MEAMKEVFLAPLGHAHALGKVQDAATFAARSFEAPFGATRSLLRSRDPLPSSLQRPAAASTKELERRLGTLQPGRGNDD